MVSALIYLLHFSNSRIREYDADSRNTQKISSGCFFVQRKNKLLKQVWEVCPRVFTVASFGSLFRRLAGLLLPSPETFHVEYSTSTTVLLLVSHSREKIKSNQIKSHIGFRVILGFLF